MIGTQERQRLRNILEQDRLWTAYALADLDPNYAEGSNWLVEEDAVILHYIGLEPPVLFLHGPSESLAQRIEEIPPGRVQFMVRAPNRPLLMQYLQPDFEVEMWRMALDLARFTPPSETECRPLGPEDLSAITSLTADHPDRPDAFSEYQLAHGVFFGYWLEDRLVAMAGTHVLSEMMDVAAIGNVFTDPAHRGQGYGTAVSAAVTRELVEREIGTIVLNVAKDNRPAVAVYENLGFWPVYGYYEGVGIIKTPTQ
ncbi:MAG: GNAT family N-acetyltransferase [Anaerolineales bacterium]